MGVRDVSSRALVLVVTVGAMLVLVTVVAMIALESGRPIGKTRCIIAIQKIVNQYLPENYYYYYYYYYCYYSDNFNVNYGNAIGPKLCEPPEDHDYRGPDYKDTTV